MKSINDICFIVQARLNSERIPQKMTKPFCGSTLTDLVLQKLLACNIPKEQIYLSVHENELKDIGKNYPIRIWERSYESANVDKGIQTLFDWWDKLPYKYVVMVSGCNPFLKPQTINNFISTFINSKNEGLFAVTENKNYFWDSKGNMLNQWPEGQDLLNTKAVDTTYEAAHCLYASRLDSIGKGKWVGNWQTKNDPELYVMKSPIEAFDIDYPWQFTLAENLFQLNDIEYSTLINHE